MVRKNQTLVCTQCLLEFPHLSAREAKNNNFHAQHPIKKGRLPNSKDFVAVGRLKSSIEIIIYYWNLSEDVHNQYNDKKLNTL